MTIFQNGTRVQDILNDGLILTVESHEIRDNGEILYSLADPSPHVPNWMLTHDEILTDERHGGRRWTVLS